MSIHKWWDMNLILDILIKSFTRMLFSKIFVKILLLKVWKAVFVVRIVIFSSPSSFFIFERDSFNLSLEIFCESSPRKVSSKNDKVPFICTKFIPWELHFINFSLKILETCNMKICCEIKNYFGCHLQWIWQFSSR